MNKPLHNYFVHAVHKPYLASISELEYPASTEMLSRALLLGGRMLELDLWDGAAGEPEVPRGPSLALASP